MFNALQNGLWISWQENGLEDKSVKNFLEIISSLPWPEFSRKKTDMRYSKAEWEQSFSVGSIQSLVWNS